MSEYYQRIKNNPYRLPDNVYRQTAAIIRGYSEIRKQYDEIILMDTAQRADKTSVLKELEKKMKAVEQCVIEMKEKYCRTYTNEEFPAREAYMDYGIFCYYRSRHGADTAPHRRTWLRYRQEFAWRTAKKLNYF
ncbi:MAG: hypothetical protein ACI4A5_05190 [Hominilimicola sp.]